MQFFLVVPLMLFVIVLSTSDVGAYESVDTLNIGIAYPAIKNNKERRFSRQHLNSLNVKSIRFSENWKHREPEKGKKQWKSLDKKLKWAIDYKYNIMLTIDSDGPEWATAKRNKKSALYVNDNDFKNYITSLTKRYSDKISKIQFGNEWQTKWWYIGSSEDFVRYNNIAYDAVKLNSPKTHFVLGGISIDSLRALSVCNNLFDGGEIIFDNKMHKVEELKLQCNTKAYKELDARVEYVMTHAKYDVVDIHLYDDPHNWKKYHAVLKKYNKYNKPIIVSEFGGPNVLVDKYSDKKHAIDLVKYIKALTQMNIKAAYYFKLVESDDANESHVKSGLINKKLKKKPAYKIFQKINRMKW